MLTFIVSTHLIVNHINYFIHPTYSVASAPCKTYKLTLNTKLLKASHGAAIKIIMKSTYFR